MEKHEYDAVRDSRRFPRGITDTRVIELDATAALKAVENMTINSPMTDLAYIENCCESACAAATRLREAARNAKPPYVRMDGEIGTLPADYFDKSFNDMTRVRVIVERGTDAAILKATAIMWSGEHNSYYVRIGHGLDGTCRACMAFQET